MTIKYHVENLSCAQCALKVEEKLKSIPEFKTVRLNFANASLKIDSEDKNTIEKIIQEIEPDVKISQKESKQGFNLTKEIISIAVSIGFFVFGILKIEMLESTPYRWALYATFAIPYTLMGWKVLWKAIKNIFRGNLFDENFLMTIATLGAIGINEVPEAVAVMLFYKVGETFEEQSLHKSRQSIKALLEVQEDNANLVLNHGDEIKKISAKEVKAGDHIQIKTGEKIPLDGIIISGKASLESSTLTGESIPHTYTVNQEVLSGMINLDGVIIVRVLKEFENSTLNKIIELTENAVNKKANTEKFITKFAKIYTPVVVGIAAIIAVLPPIINGSMEFSTWIYRALTLLVISCPCALVISIPLGYFGGIGAASKNGILIKGSEFIDKLNNLSMIAFDKTGTLTKGVFRLQKIYNVSKFSESELLKIAAHVESLSNHPIALAIVQAYDKKIKHNDVKIIEEISGQGILATYLDKKIVIGNDTLLHNQNISHPESMCILEMTQVHMAIDGQYAGYIEISDEIKHDVKDSLLQLKSQGIHNLMMLTGDNSIIANKVARYLSIDEVRSELLPQDKLSIIEDEIENNALHSNIAFVGDGINDAPVIARADIGIAMGGLGSDAAIDIADIVIMNDSITKIPQLLNISRFSKKVILQNIIAAFIVKAIFIILGILGLTNLWIAVFADVGVAILAILNSTRIINKEY